MLSELELQTRVEKLKEIKEYLHNRLKYGDVNNIEFETLRYDLNIVIGELLVLDFVLTGKENDSIYHLQ